jgi:4-hydroxy-3-methylbut-2-enyl diphosphate reductase
MLIKPNKKQIKIYLAGPRGFCAGVDRAILMVEKALQKFGKPVYVRHEIVHNKFVVEDLKNKGAIFIDELKQIEDLNRPVIFSAHGVPKAVPEQAKYLNLEYYDATCPLVSKIHREVENFENLKLPIVFIGHKNHPEVVGTMGQIKTEIHLVENVKDVLYLKIPLEKKIAYVTQTTLSLDDTKSIIDALKNKYKYIVEPKKNDICYATTNRQNAVKKIANKCDLFVVIGSLNSSNSLRLVEVAKKYGSSKSILLESIEDFDKSLLNNLDSIGLTASASAPEILLQNFIKFLKKNCDIELIELEHLKEKVNFNIPQKLNVTS